MNVITSLDISNNQNLQTANFLFKQFIFLWYFILTKQKPNELVYLIDNTVVNSPKYIVRMI